MFSAVARVQRHGDQLDALLDQAMREAIGLTHADAAWVTGVGGPDPDALVAIHGKSPAVLANPDQASSITELQSVVAVQVLDEQRVIGRLAVGGRERGQFSQDDGRALRVIADTVAATLRRQVRYRADVLGALQLRRCFADSCELTTTTLRYPGLEPLLETLAGLLSRRVRAEQVLDPNARDVSPAAAAPVLTLDEQAGAHRAPVIADGHVLGSILVDGEDPLNEVDRHSVLHAALLAAPILAREHAAQEAEWQMKGSLIEQLLETSGEPSGNAIRRAAKLGIHPDCLAPILVVRSTAAGSGARLLKKLCLRFAMLTGRPVGTVLAFARNSEVVLSLDNGLPKAGKDANALLTRLLSVEDDANVHLFAGLSRSNIPLAPAYREADALSKIAVARDQAGIVLQPRDLAFGASLLASERLEQTTLFVQSTLGPLWQREKSSRLPLLETLLHFAESGFDRAAMARRYFLPASTLQYHLQQIEKVTGRLDGAHLTEIATAVTALRIIEAKGMDPLSRLVK